MPTEKQLLDALRNAIEITKEAARSGGGGPENILDRCYKRIVSIMTDIENQSNTS
jgi:hypothetical protein